MCNIICVAGLPGSGKTMLARRILHNHLCDDIQELNELPNMTHGNLVIVDPWFCRESVRLAAGQKIVAKYKRNPNWIFFSNDPDACLANVAARNDGRRVQELIRRLSKEYTPVGNDIRPVWKRNYNVQLPYHVPVSILNDNNDNHNQHQIEWCLKNVSRDAWLHDQCGFEFAQREDAVMFRLAWM